ncbi:mannitol dehydrogenase family protein [Humibacter antri]
MRLAHLGLGHFHRAHQAWYTQHVNALPDTDSGASDGWGIAAFTGRSPRAAEMLAAQDCVYGLITRAADGDTAEIVQSIVRAHDGASAEWEATLAESAVAVLTVTVTERGYETAHDTGAVTVGESAGARIVRGLAARARASAGPIALVSCDNLSGNGEALRRAVLTEVDDEELASWIGDNVSFVSTMVDRITPDTTDADRAMMRDLTGYDDTAPVVAEPFSEWMVSGAFPAGRPEWERVGTHFVDDIEPYERRKLWLLNAGHTMLAAMGIPRGHETVAEAFADPECRMLLEALWAEARVVLPFDDETTDAFLCALRTRFSNPRIAHRLTQIDDGSLQKLRQRQAAIVAARLAVGNDPGRACLATVESWGSARGLDLAEALDALQPGLAWRVAAS